MSTTWYPPGLEVHVDNPGYGEIVVIAPTFIFDGRPLVTTEWRRDLYGPKIGEFLTRVTHRALDTDVVAPDPNLPKFVTTTVARTLLPVLQQAAVLAAAGTDRYERTFPDPDVQPPAPLCLRCSLGTYFTPGAMQSDWCDEHGHSPFGMATRSWDRAQEMHGWAVGAWERARERRSADLRAPATDPANLRIATPVPGRPATESDIKIIGRVDGRPSPFDGQWVVDYDPKRPGTDPDGKPMTIHLRCSPDRAQARRFPNPVAAHDYWRTPSGKPHPADRPLTAFHIMIEEVAVRG